jgi:hypothetical protein
LSCIGYTVLLADVSDASKIVAACITASGLYPSIILLNSWLLANTDGCTKRATVWAMAEVCKDHSFPLGLLFSGLIVNFILMWWIQSANQKRDTELKEFEKRGQLHPHKMKGLEEVQDYHIDSDTFFKP